MLKLRIYWGLALLVPVGNLQVAQAALGISLGDHEVHPTRILARYHNAQAALEPQALSLLSNLGLEVKQEFPLVPGLVALDESPGQLARMAVVTPPTPEHQAETLRQRIAALRRSGQFQYVEPNYVNRVLLEPNDIYYLDGTLWGLRNDGGNGGVVGADISAREAWDITTGSTNVVVAVIDTGVRYTHQDLAAQMWINVGEWGTDTNGVDLASNGIDDDGNGVVDDVHGINAVDAAAITGDPIDLEGHGTHVAGTIGAAANNGAPHVGVAWDVRIMACKFLGPMGGFTDGAIACIQYATTNGVQVMNNSWGGGPFSSALLDTIDESRKAGVLFLAAAGNDGTDNDLIPHYPSNYRLDNVISVASVDRADRLSWFSNFGVETVDLGAPGEEIWSSTATSDQSYEPFQGTSMATPHVSGVAALIYAFNPSATIFEARQRILQTVVKIPALDGITITGGRLNAYKALTASGDGQLELSITPAEESVILAGSTQQVFAVVTDLFGITDATVEGQFIAGSSDPLVFRNDGVAPDQEADDSVYSGEFLVPTLTPPDEFLLLEVIASAPDKIGITNVVRWFVAEPPTNDNFVDAAKIPAEGRVLYSLNQFATMEFPDEPFHAGVPTVDASLWWAWSPSFDNHVIIDTAGSDFDTVVAVYTNSPLASAREVVSADNSAGRQQAFVEFDAARGVTYYIAVASATRDVTGSIRLRVEPNGFPDTLPPLVEFLDPGNGSVVTTNRVLVSGLSADPRPASGVSRVLVQVQGDLIWKRATGTTNWSVNLLLQPGLNTISASAVDFARNQSDPVHMMVDYMPPTTPNDHFKNAMALEGSTGLVNAFNEFATKEFLEPFHGGNQGGRSIWYRWTAPADGVLTLSTASTNTTYDTLLGVYTGTVVTNLTTIAGNDDAAIGDSTSMISLGVVSGTEYSIAVDGFAGGGGDAELLYDFVVGEIRRLDTAAGSNGRVTPESGDYASGTSVTVTAVPDPGYVFEGWTGTVTSAANPLELVMDQDHSVTGSFVRPTITDDFESGGFNPEINYILSSPGSSAAWSVVEGDSAGGEYAARSGVISDNQQSILALEEPMIAGVGSFWYRVSSEAEFDVLEFRVNGDTKPSWMWSGQSDWIFFQFVVPEGTNKLEWVYRKDPSLSNGEDTVFIDNLEIPVFRPVDQVEVALHMVAEPSGFSVMLRGEPGRRYSVEVSTDLQQWTEVSRVTARADGSVTFNDPQPATHTTRYYRARGM
jgi:subtilisin family serine protease